MFQSKKHNISLHIIRVLTTYIITAYIWVFLVLYNPNSSIIITEKSKRYIWECEETITYIVICISRIQQYVARIRWCVFPEFDIIILYAHPIFVVVNGVFPVQYIYCYTIHEDIDLQFIFEQKWYWIPRVYRFTKWHWRQ